MLGARPRDISPDKDGCVGSGSGGMTVGPDPKRLHPHFRPKRYGGLSALPLFVLSEAELVPALRYAPDGGDRESGHGVVEAVRLMLVAAYQEALAATAHAWRPAE